MPGLKGTFLAKLSVHQSQAAIPGLIQDVSAMAQGGLRFRTISLVSISRPGVGAIISTRHGVDFGVAATTGCSMA